MFNKTFLFPLIFALAFTNAAYSQNQPELILYVKGKLPNENEKEAEYKGGLNALFCFLENAWDTSLINQVDSGFLEVGFSLTKKGEVENIILKPHVRYSGGLGDGKISVLNQKLHREVLSIMEKMPNWKPRMRGKRPVKTKYTAFNLIFPYHSYCQ